MAPQEKILNMKQNIWNHSKGQIIFLTNSWQSSEFFILKPSEPTVFQSRRFNMLQVL